MQQPLSPIDLRTDTYSRWTNGLRYVHAAGGFAVAPLLVLFAWVIDAEPLLAGDVSARPNILWISCEDISPMLGCYGYEDADTPNLDRLAAEGTRYSHAFSCHGVCAPSRTGIITGMYPIALGANHMRSKVRLPAHVRLFPEYLREAGYYCTNNSKTDYNLIWDSHTVWDESSGKAHWKHRASPEQPFFAVFNLTMTHESKVWPSGWAEVVSRLPETDRHRPETVTVPPLYPDTPSVREDLARLADLITVMDLEVGRLLKELETAGLSERTIVFFWSDHGNGLPRSKRWTYDSGSRVPLIVRVPEKFRNLAASATAGTVDNRMINLIDLGHFLGRTNHRNENSFLELVIGWTNALTWFAPFAHEIFAMCET
jgi:N-sulfoglucosamine sulfohydrolase